MLSLLTLLCEQSVPGTYTPSSNRIYFVTGLHLSGAQSIQVPFFHELLILFVLSANLAMLVEFL